MVNPRNPKRGQTWRTFIDNHRWQELPIRRRHIVRTNDGYRRNTDSLWCP
jgi:hypothetical protein